MLQGLLVSIHAPARGAISLDYQRLLRCGFNSRTRKGCDLLLLKLLQLIAVSIHAPARGAINAGVREHRSHSFNSRTRKGCDFLSFATSKLQAFQFTHPQGVR